MKNTLSLVFAGMVGGIITLGGSQLLNPQQTETFHINHQNADLETDNESVVQLTNGNQTTTIPSDFTGAAEKAMPSVVNITSTTEVKARSAQEERYYKFFGEPQPSQSTGSGVIISSKGYIVTNNHVINGATKVEVTLSDNRNYEAKVVGTDPSTDLAVLEIEATDLPVAPMANSDNAKVGEWVLAVGNPFELTSTVTAGIISAKGRDISILNGQYSIESFIQTDAAVNPGNSGGALVNTKGELIGINTAIATLTGSYSGYSFAVPINLVKKVVQDLIDFGEVKRGYLGVMIQNVNSAVAEKLGLSVTEGVYVDKLLEGGAAIAAGMKEGDVIVGVDGFEIKSVPELQEQIGSRNPGDSVLVSIIRESKKKDLSVKLKN